tara:strand:+ start:12887 stop:14398 length:1512 start_codon:yes stop_codon:yes gene_type:complete
MTENKDKQIERPPVIVIMGHIDHGKSTLLDYIRKTNVVEKESGGITQHLGAYEVIHTDQSDKKRSITFLDTPGHEAFSAIRSCGAEVADIAILVVSAEEGMKAQTNEALSCIKEAKLPYIVAINKIDKSGADIERTKKNLLENEVYLEGLGGDIPFVPISAKTGEGVPELLDMTLLVSDLEELSAESDKEASGVVIESHVDPKKGVSATLIVKNGTLNVGTYVVAGDAFSPVRIMENFKGEQIKKATFSSPVQIIGFSKTPVVGMPFTVCKTKKEAEKVALEYTKQSTPEVPQKETMDESSEQNIIPLIIKADATGSLEAIEHELSKMEFERADVRIVQKGVGAISEGDIKAGRGNPNSIVAGFNVSVDGAAKGQADQSGIAVETFDVIYKLSEWLEDEIRRRIPKVDTEDILGQAKILKVFSSAKGRQTIGGRVDSGTLSVGGTVNILRRDEQIGTGTITNLQQQRADTKEITEGNEFGAEIESETDVVSGDVIERFVIVQK